jgi:hypothetical protein
MKPSMKFLVLSAADCVLAGGLALAQAPTPKKVPGEKWSVKMSMQAQGMSMPGRTMEACVPKQNPDEQLMKSDPKNCTVSNFKRSGNKTSADMKCTGKEAMEGHWEIEKVNDKTMRGSMDAKMSGMAMKMQYEYTRLGAACDATVYQ